MAGAVAMAIPSETVELAGSRCVHGEAEIGKGENVLLLPIAPEVAGLGDRIPFLDDLPNAIDGIGLSGSCVLEWIGDRTLQSRLFLRLGSAARIALAVPVLILLLILASYIIVLGGRVIGSS